MMKRLGAMMLMIREGVGASQQQVARGMLSVPNLSRVESGQREIDIVMMEALLERLGITLDKMELFLTWDEVYPLVVRYNVLESLKKSEEEQYAYWMEEYKKSVDATKAFHKQYILQMKAIMEYEKTKDIAKCKKYVENAIAETFPEWKSGDWSDICLCGQELQLFLMYAYLCIQQEKMTLAEELLQWIEEYIERRILDGQEKVKVYPQCMLLQGLLYQKQNQKITAYEACKKGKQVLVENGSLTVMREILQLETECLEEQNPERKKNEKYIQAIDFLYEYVGMVHSDNMLLQIVLISRQYEISVSNEVLKELREANGLSQDELAGDICSRETLSRIEAGRKPNKDKLYRMMRYMGIERERYYGFVIADEYRVYEMVREYNRLIPKRKADEAYTVLCRIAELIDLSIPVNRQFVECGYIRQQLYQKKITNEDAIEKLKELLFLTMPEIPSKGLVYRVPFRQEFVLLNQMSFCYRNMNRVEKAYDIWEQIAKKYQNSKLNMYFHGIAGFLLYVNYLGTLEVLNQLEDAEKIGKQGVVHALQCAKGDFVGGVLGNLFCVYEKKQLQEDERNCIKYASHLFELYEREKQSKQLQEMYEWKYGNSI